MLARFARAETPEQIRDLFLEMGFSGVLFQRWYAGVMANWEGTMPPGFLEHYYATQLYKWCPVARAIHQWRRDYTFAEARAAILVGDPRAEKAERLFSNFGISDGVVLFSGRNSLRSATVLMSRLPVEQTFTTYGPMLAYAARCLERILHSGNATLERITRDDPRLSETQERILQMQIEHPEFTMAEMAELLGMSVKTLRSHHEKIAKKTNVSNFAGAVVERMTRAL